MKICMYTTPTQMKFNSTDVSCWPFISVLFKNLSVVRSVRTDRGLEMGSRLHIYFILVKLKCALVQSLRLCTGLTAHRRSRDIAPLFHDHDTRRGWRVSVTPRPLFTPVHKDPVPIVQEAVWAPGQNRCGKSRPPPGFDPWTSSP
jgi:hypothetical protein